MDVRRSHRSDDFLEQAAARDDRRMHRSRFRINVISEPPIAPDTPRELIPDFLEDRPEKAFLCFLFFVLEAR